MSLRRVFVASDCHLEPLFGQHNHVNSLSQDLLDSYSTAYTQSMSFDPSFRMAGNHLPLSLSPFEKSHILDRHEMHDDVMAPSSFPPRSFSDIDMSSYQDPLDAQLALKEGELNGSNAQLGRDGFLNAPSEQCMRYE